MKSKKAALYDPYLDVLGGGERYSLSILRELEEQGYEITIYWDTDLTQAIKNKLNITFKQPVKFKPNIFKTKGFLGKLMELVQYDSLLYVTDGSYFFSSAKKTYIYCMVPQKNLYKMNALNKAKTRNMTWITHSLFTQERLRNWGIETQVLYPYLSEEFLSITTAALKKQNEIISVGRFFKQLHSKRHDITIRFYKDLKTYFKHLKHTSLTIAGGLKDEDKGYFDELQSMAEGDRSIKLLPNVSHDELMNLYTSSQFYWHMAGYGEDEDEHPEMVEHLGIAPLEAMAAGCITFCYRAGGAKELIDDGVNGFLFTTEDELFEKMDRIMKDKNEQKKIQEKAKQFVTEHFNRDIFSQNVKKIFI